MRRGQASSSKSVSTKKLTISDYRRRLKDNVRSLSENLTRMVQAAKVFPLLTGFLVYSLFLDPDR